MDLLIWGISYNWNHPVSDLISGFSQSNVSKVTHAVAHIGTSFLLAVEQHPVV